MKFRKKPIVIEAVQWFPGDEVSGVQRLSHMQAKENNIDAFYRYGWIETLEGGHVVSPGDWIITGIAGEKYPCKDHIFKETYEPVE